MNPGATPIDPFEVELLLALPFALALHALTALPAATERDQTLDEHATRNLRPL